MLPLNVSHIAMHWQMNSAFLVLQKYLQTPWYSQARARPVGITVMIVISVHAAATTTSQTRVPASESPSDHSMLIPSLKFLEYLIFWKSTLIQSRWYNGGKHTSARKHNTYTFRRKRIPMNEIWKLLHCSDHHTVSQKLVWSRSIIFIFLFLDCHNCSSGRTSPCKANLATTGRAFRLPYELP